MNIPIDVIAAFNKCGDVKPLFIRTEDKNKIHISKLSEVVIKKTVKILGTTIVEFSCTIIMDGTTQYLDIIYNIELQKWHMVIN